MLSIIIVIQSNIIFIRKYSRNIFTLYSLKFQKNIER